MQKQAKQVKSRYTQSFKEEAVRLVLDKGQSMTSTAKALDIPVQTLHGWLLKHQKGELIGADYKAPSAEQIELARLRAENARLTMERDILKKATAYFAQHVK
jgi:transposase